MNKIYEEPRRPVDRVAARVLGKGVDYTPDEKIMTADQDMPIPVRTYIHPDARHFIGKKFGRMTVIGQALNAHKRWVVRCQCGTYTLRKMKSVNNPNNQNDCCENWRHLLYLKRAEYKRRTGKDIQWGDL